MPTFRKDIHLGHDVAQIDTDDIVNGAITEEKMADDSVSTRALQDRCVTEPKLADDAVSNRTIQDKAVTEPKLADDSVSHRTILPNAVDGSNIKPGSIGTQHLEDGAVTTPKIKDKAVTPEKVSDDMAARLVLPVTDSLDEKYTNITNELYDMIASLQVGGVALSGQFGDRTDIGIHQKALTKAIGGILDILGNLTHHNYMDFTLTVVPTTIYKEGTSRVTITCDCSEAISDFDNIKVYVDDILIAESSDQRVFITSANITDTSVIKAVGTIFGKVITKQTTVTKEIPFFMGGGNVYTDIMNEANRKVIQGTLEGDYDATISTAGQYLFVIIPISRKEEYRRCKMDMSGVEISFAEEEKQDYIVCKSLNTFNAGTYNIDIDINS